MKVIDLFSGIGGFSLGLESTGGFETVQFVEYDKWCQKVLAKNFPNVPITGDIKDYEGQRADVVTGGFPCQPFSVAGKRKGTDDDRHLWPEMLRVIKASKPRFVIGENVRNITSIQDGMVFEQVCTDLENEGYEVQSFIIPASAVEAPHQRYRVWIVAHSDSIRNQSNLRETSREGEGEKISNTQFSSRGDGRNTISSASRDEKQSTNVEHSKLNGCSSTKIRGSIKETVRQESQGENRTLDFEGTGSLSETATNVAKTKVSDRYAHEINSEHGKSKAQEILGNRSSLSGESSEQSLELGLGGMVDGLSKRLDRHEGFDREPNISRVATGQKDRVNRLKGLGNAIVPQIAHQIGLAILEAELSKLEE
tara:strand:- start:659 stop:1759 length:1101 start_codon:yes stop_codon:yes gene_type:complete